VGMDEKEEGGVSHTHSHTPSLPIPRGLPQFSAPSPALCPPAPAQGCPHRGLPSGAPDAHGGASGDSAMQLGQTINGEVNTPGPLLTEVFFSEPLWTPDTAFGYLEREKKNPLQAESSE